MSQGLSRRSRKSLGCQTQGPVQEASGAEEKGRCPSPEARCSVLSTQAPRGREEHPSRCARSWGFLDGVSVGCPSWAWFGFRASDRSAALQPSPSSKTRPSAVLGRGPSRRPPSTPPGLRGCAGGWCQGLARPLGAADHWHIRDGF